MSNKLASGRKPFAWIALVAIFSLVFGGISSAAPSWAEEGEGSPSPSSPQSSVESQAPQAPESTQASEPESKDQPSQTTEKQAPSSLKATPTQKVESSKAQKPQASSSPKTTKAKGEPKKSQAPPTPKTSKTTPSSNRSSPPTLDRYSTFTVSACEKVTVSLSSSAPVAYTISFFIEEPWQQVGTSFNLVPGGTKTVGLPAGTFIAIAAAEGMRQEINQVTVVECAPAPVKDATADVTTSPATCEATGSAQVSGLANATLVGTLDQTVGTHAATFKANEGHLFADGSTTKTVSYTVQAQLTGEQCAELPVVKKIKYCHATGSETNPYVEVDTSIAAFYNAGHVDHQNDIWPAFSYKKDGKVVQVKAQGDQSILENGCKIPPAPVKDATADVTTSPATCEATGSAQVSGLANATLVGTLDQTVGTHAATFKANEGHLFADGSTTKTVSYTVQAQLTGEQCGVIPPSDYRLETSHNTQTCGSVTITLRNVSPWIYPVSYSLDGSEPNASGPNYGPVVDNRTNGTVNGPAKDQTGSKTLTFTEDQGGGQVTVKYVVAAGTESDLYRGKPVGTVTTVLVDTNCQPDPVPVSPVGPTKVDLCEPLSGSTQDGVVIEEDPSFTYQDKATGEQLETGFNRVEGGSITILAVPKEGVVVKEGSQTEWTFEFTKEACATDVIYAPEGSVSVTCEKGSATLDNRKSTIEVVYQLVRNGKSSHHAVPAGETQTVEFAGGENVKVALWALDALLDEAASPAKCGKVPPTKPGEKPTTPPTKPGEKPTIPPTKPGEKSTEKPTTPPTDNRKPNNRPPTTGGAGDDASLALGALASGFVLAIGVVLAATRRRK